MVEFNLDSNYDLAGRLIANGQEGWDEPPLSSANSQFTNEEYYELLNAVGASGQILSDLNRDGIIGTSDLLVLLSAFNLAISDEYIQAIQEVDANNLPPIPEGDIQSTDDGTDEGGTDDEGTNNPI